MPAEPKSQRSILAILASKAGLLPKVVLTDLDSAHGPTPVVGPNTEASKLVPQGRGNYQLLGEIARGGMGVILKGHDTDLGRDVAVKVLDGELAKQPAVVQRFVEEAQIGGQLQHPGIVPVYELGLMADDRPYFTMKLVKGRTLAALFQQRQSPLDDRGRLLAIFESVCQTMAYAHSKGVLHRDLKPANVMVGAFGEVQVVDWGLAKVLRRTGGADEKQGADSTLTVIETVRSGSGSSGSDSMAGSIMGTPAYMAPEQAQGEVEKLDERADVFALGAVLCELLTGRPPYEPVAGQPLVAQAARAELAPARARIEACDADRALVRVCLDCLMPAPAARPANAEKVADAVHAYLTSTEERARKAELAAAEARIKAAEERRARRLTLALGSTIVVALLVGGGGVYWVSRERAQRVAQTRAAVEAAHGESIEFERAGMRADALASARRALSLAETGDADAALLDRARVFVAKAALEVETVERERELARQDAVLRARLVDLRLEQIDTIQSRPRATALDAAFTQAFRDFGVDLEAADLVPALERIREREIAEEVALALDDWARVRREVSRESSEKAENLFYLAMDLDPDPGRTRLRQAIFDHDVAALLDLAAPENVSKLAPGSISVLTAALIDVGTDENLPVILRMYDQALELHPGDFVLQSIGGFLYQVTGRQEASMNCRAAALSLRPDDPNTRASMADSLLYLGRLTEAEAVYRACLGVAPSHSGAHQGLSETREQLGDFADALVHGARALELEDFGFWRAKHLALLFRMGLVSKDDVVIALADEKDPVILAIYLYALVAHPDPARRDPQLVLRTLAEQAALFETTDWGFLLETVARVCIEDWTGALTAVRDHFGPTSVLMLTPCAFDFLRALIYGRTGREDAARECYGRGMSKWNELTGDDPAAWERSDVMRWRREAEAALAR